MRPKQNRRKPAKIPNSRWLAYATAGATSAFACTHSAEAKLHYSGLIHRGFNGCYENATYELDQPGDFIRLLHSLLACSGGYSGGAFFNVGGRAGASIAGVYNTAISCRFNPISASNLERGQFISSRPFVPAIPELAVLAQEGACPGQFVRGGIGFIGFKFNNGSGDQYGWARIQTQSRYANHIFILRDFAYGDVNDRIRAGQKSSNEMVPDKGSLGWLALGAAGLLAWRKNHLLR